LPLNGDAYTRGIVLIWLNQYLPFLVRNSYFLTINDTIMTTDRVRNEHIPTITIIQFAFAVTLYS